MPNVIIVFLIVLIGLSGCVKRDVSSDSASTNQMVGSSTSRPAPLVEKKWVDTRGVNENSTKEVKIMTTKVEKLVRSVAEWKALLTPEQYHVLREKGTERAYNGSYYANDQTGIYQCAACDLPLFDSYHKYDSGSGWPSFYQTINLEHVGEIDDHSLGMVRMEVICNRCDSHLGHVFNDGPPPTNQRYCINSISLKFVKP